MVHRLFSSILKVPALRNNFLTKMTKVAASDCSSKIDEVKNKGANLLHFHMADKRCLFYIAVRQLSLCIGMNLFHQFRADYNLDCIKSVVLLIKDS